jgi:hypothetical protein
MNEIEKALALASMASRSRGPVMKNEDYEKLNEQLDDTSTRQQQMDAAQEAMVAKKQERLALKQRQESELRAAQEVEVELAEARDEYVTAATKREAQRLLSKDLAAKAKTVADNVERRREELEAAKLRFEEAVDEQIRIDREVLALNNPALDENLAGLKKNLRDLFTRCNEAWGNINPKKKRKELRNNELRKSIRGMLQ